MTVETISPEFEANYLQERLEVLHCTHPGEAELTEAIS